MVCHRVVLDGDTTGSTAYSMGWRRKQREQQLGDGSVGGYYFGAFYQQAAAEPAFNGVPDNDGAWHSLGDWQASRADAVDAASTDPVWIAYASGYISSSDVITVSSPQVFAEFSTQYSNDGFSTITGVSPTDPDRMVATRYIARRGSHCPHTIIPHRQPVDSCLG